MRHPGAFKAAGSRFYIFPRRRGSMIMYPQIAQMNTDSLVPMQSVVGGPWLTMPMCLRRDHLAMGEDYGGSRPIDFVYFVCFVVEPEKGRCTLIAEASTRSISPWGMDVYRRLSTARPLKSTPPRGECTDACKALFGNDSRPILQFNRLFEVHRISVDSRLSR